MRSPFPGMDPYLEHPSLWPDVHNSLIGALRDDLAQRIAPRYYIRLEEHTYLVSLDRYGLPGSSSFVGKPDLSFIAERNAGAAYGWPEPSGGVVEIEVPALYERARYDLSLDYTQPPAPPVREEDVMWAWERIEQRQA